MLEHYSHVRLDLKRKALDGLATRPGNLEDKLTRYDKNNDTTQPSCTINPELSYRKYWSAREESNPGLELRLSPLSTIYLARYRAIWTGQLEGKT